MNESIYGTGKAEYLSLLLRACLLAILETEDHPFVPSSSISKTVNRTVALRGGKTLAPMRATPSRRALHKPPVLCVSSDIDTLCDWMPIQSLSSYESSIFASGGQEPTIVVLGRWLSQPRLCQVVLPVTIRSLTSCRSYTHN